MLGPSATYQRGREKLLAATARVPLDLLDVLAQRVLLDAKVHRRTARGEGEAHVGVAALGAREEQQVGDAEGPAHDDVVLELVAAALLEPAGSAGLHDAAHVGGELA